MTSTLDADRCLLLFSGGRDSTLAAVRLGRAFPALTLVTVTSDHLHGIDAVHRRLAELRAHLPSAEWVHVRQPRLKRITDDVEDRFTCLPCHLAYITVGAALASARRCRHVALGYAGYQSDWPEQTAHATACLQDVLAAAGYTLHLPVYDLMTKNAAVEELTAHGLSAQSLEQKCALQKFHRTLDAGQLSALVRSWADSVSASIVTPPSIDVLDRRCW